jgi:hypothetical protein
MHLPTRPPAHPHPPTPAADAGCRNAVRERLLGEMLNGIKDPIGAGWKALIMDAVTTRVMSAALKMSDLQEAGEHYY